MNVLKIATTPRNLIVTVLSAVRLVLNFPIKVVALSVKRGKKVPHEKAPWQAREILSAVW